MALDERDHRRAEPLEQLARRFIEEPPCRIESLVRARDQDLGLVEAGRVCPRAGGPAKSRSMLEVLAIKR